MTIHSRRVPQLLPGHYYSDRCAGCETQPTSGYDSKPADADGLVRWCENSRRLASAAEIAQFYELSPRERCTAAASVLKPHKQSAALRWSRGGSSRVLI